MKTDTNIRLLIVEDNEKIRKLLCSILQNVGFKHLVEAGNGKEAFDNIQKEKFDLVITDWMMPEMNGIELLKAIRNSAEDYKSIPVLMITASDKSENVVEAAKFKINGYIIKPFSVKVILAKIDEVMSH